VSYRRILPNGIEIRNTEPEDAQALEQLQNLVFPSLADSQRLKAAHYLNHIKIFPAGQFVAYSQKKLVAMTTSIRLSEKFLKAKHNFDEVILGGFCNSHEPAGEWLYGIDMGTNPEYRGRGLARALYVARHQLVRELGLKGQYTVGMISGYGALKEQYTRQEYFEALKQGSLTDPTVGAQVKIGFEIQYLVEDYLSDPSCDDCGVSLILSAEKQIADLDSFYR
jgi:GNAT superfamily N-acetyltransferase